MSSNGNNKRSVRFSESTDAMPPTKRSRPINDDDDGGDDDDNDRKLAAKPLIKKKKKEDRMNEDELDDIDDWKGDDDDDDNIADVDIPSEKQLLEAKRQRRQQRDSEFNSGDTHIDAETSLASEGVQIEPFHMRNEETDGTGYFDGDTFVFRRNDQDGDEPDAWADSLRDENGNPTTDLAKVPATSTSVTSRSAQDELDDLTKEQLYERILPLVSDTETVARAIRRYGQLVKHRHKQKQKRGTAAKDDNENDVAKSSLDDLTGVSNALLLKGEVNIYDTTRESILRMLPSSPKNAAAAAAAESEIPKNVTWEYMGNQDNQLHGPFTSEQMLAWTKSGYFVGAQRVKIRYIHHQQPDQEKEEVSTKDDLLADLMDDDEEEEPPSKKTKTANSVVVRGEWMWSNEVDYQKYL
jgi:CD2 antigen cytoplasmic tail-binding protein 2